VKKTFARKMIAMETTFSWAASNGGLATVIVARTKKGSYTTILHLWMTRAAKEQEIPQWHADLLAYLD